MAKTKRKYIESHWLIFAIKGAAAFLLGAFALFTTITDPRNLILIIAIALIILGLTETFNIIHRRHRQHDWGLALIIALIELATAAALLYTKNLDNIVASTVIVAAYTVLRGLFEIFIGIKSLTDKTDKFMWIVCGIVGTILGIIIFSYPAADNTTFIKIFGTYMMIFGLTDLIFAVHSKNELSELPPANRSKKHKK
jgi:uncharacterized membrane protein HdeD (DUF308 family)